MTKRVGATGDVATSVESEYGLRMPISKWIAIAVVLAAASAARAQNVTPIERRLVRGYETIREERLRADLTFLASDELQGRMSLQPGDAAAIRWIESEFAKAGLKPAA